MNLLNLLKYQMGPETSAQIASLLGEEPQAVQSALEAALPTTLSVLVKKAADPRGASEIMDTLKRGGHDGAILGMLDGAFKKGGNGKQFIADGQTLARQFIGDKQPQLCAALNHFSGVREKSAQKIVQLSMPLVLGTVGSQVKQQGLDVSGLMYLLSTQKGHIGAALPSGFANADVLNKLEPKTVAPQRPAAPPPSPEPVAPPTKPQGERPKTLNERLAEKQREAAKQEKTVAAKTVPSAPKQQKSASYQYDDKPRRSGFLRALPFIIGGLLLLALLIWGIRSCGGEVKDGPALADNKKTEKPEKRKENQAPPQTASETDSAPASEDPPAEDRNDQANTTTPPPSGDFQQQLESLLSGGNYKGRKISMDGLAFRGNSSMIERDTRQIVNELAEVMRQNPDLNISLSATPFTRAVSVKKALMDAGINRDRISTSGGGNGGVEVELR